MYPSDAATMTETRAEDSLSMVSGWSGRVIIDASRLMETEETKGMGA